MFPWSVWKSQWIWSWLESGHPVHSIQFTCCRALAGPWKSLIFFSRFSRPGKSLKTDMVLESPWICVWRSFKVLELDFLKRRRLRSALLPVKGFWGPEMCLECVVPHGPHPAGGATLVGWGGDTPSPTTPPSSASLVPRFSCLYPSYGLWKSLKSLNLILTNWQEPGVSWLCMECFHCTQCWLMFIV